MGKRQGCVHDSAGDINTRVEIMQGLSCLYVYKKKLVSFFVYTYLKEGREGEIGEETSFKKARISIHFTLLDNV